MPRNTNRWRRPYTAIYSDNYKFGNSLYASTLEGIDRKHRAGSEMPSPVIPPHYSAATAAALAEAEAEAAAPTGVRRMKSFSDFDTLRWSGTELSDQVANMLSDDVVRRRKRRTILDEATVDSKIPEDRTLDAFDSTSVWMDKCRELQAQLAGVAQSVAETRARLEQMRPPSSTEISALAAQTADSDRTAQELARTVRRQERLIEELQSNQEAIQKQLEQSDEQLTAAQRQCDSLRSELNRLKSNVDQAVRSTPNPQTPLQNDKSALKSETSKQ